MTEPIYRYKLTNNFWQGFVFAKITFPELEKIDTDEIRELLAADIIEPNAKLEK